MNRFCLSLENEDLGVTPIENIFINHYLPRAPGDFVKVYLLGLKYCFNSSSSISNRVIAKTLDLLESDVVKAWTYWEDQNIIRIEHQDQGENLIHFLNIKEVVLNKSSSLSNKKPNTADKIISSRKNKKIKDMHEVIEKCMADHSLLQKFFFTNNGWRIIPLLQNLLSLCWKIVLIEAVKKWLI